MNRQLYMGGGIMDIVPREPALFGGIKRAVKKATNTVKKIVKSPIGKAATAYALTAGLGSLGAGASRAGSGSMFGFLNPENVMSNLVTTGGRIGSLFSGVKNVDTGDLSVVPGKFSTSPVGKFLSSKIGGGITKGIALGGLSAFMTSQFGVPQEEVESVLSDPGEKEKYLRLYYTNLNKNATDDEVEEFVRNNLAGGGRIGFAEGTYKDFEEFMMRRSESMSERQKEELRKQFEMYMRSKDSTVEAAQGGRIGFDNGTPDPKSLGLMGIPRQDVQTPTDRSLDLIIEGEKYNVKDPEEMVVIIVMGPDGQPMLKRVPKSEAMQIDETTVPRMQQAEGSGDELPPDPTTPVNPFKPKPIGPVLPNKMMASNIENDKILEALFEKYIDMGLSPKDAAEKAKEEFDRMSNMRIQETRGLAAIGGKMDTASDNAMQAAGIEGLPVRQNPKGVKELDLRNTGGFIQPVGIKEKEDDIPAMLSNNEFVFTADAVRGMGDGNVDVGAQRMYDMMKTLEAGGRV